VAPPKVKEPLLVAVPPGVVTVIVPLEPLPVTAVIWVAKSTRKLVASVPPNLTAVAPVKLVPVMTTESPVQPDVGSNEVIVATLGSPTTKSLRAATPVVCVLVPVLMPTSGYVQPLLYLPTMNLLVSALPRISPETKLKVAL
jgi:hypothetical protein